MSHCDLKQLLKDSITKKKSLIHEYYHYQDSSLDEKSDFERLLFASVENISMIPKKKIEEIVDSFPITKDCKKELKKQLDTIVTILKLNSINGTTMKLDDSQIEVLNTFLKYLHDYVASRKSYILKNNINIDDVEEKNEKYKRLATLLNNPKNKQFITDIDTLNILFEDNDLDEENRRKILISLIKYNRNLFNYKIGFTDSDATWKYGNLDANKVKLIFDKYKYDFSKLDSKYQNMILEYGNLSNIRGVLAALSRYHYPKINEKKYGYTLTSLVLASDIETIKQITTLAGNKKISPEKLLLIPSVLINPLKSTVENYKDVKFMILDDVIYNKNKPYIAGASIEFVKNVSLLEKYGLLAKTVYDRCPELLAFPNKTLENNLELFLEYGFSFRERRTRLIDSSLAALLSNSFSEIVDQFIEIHPYGIKYLRDNLSCIKTITKADDVLFYNIYYSLRENNDRAFRSIISNNKDYLSLAGDVNSRFDNNYMGITDSNKYDITNTIIPEFKNRYKYLEILRNDYNRSIDVDIFDNKYIQMINIFSDRKEPLVYNFAGIRISKIKVLRIFNILLKNGITDDIDSFLFALTYNTIISQDDYERLVNCVKNCEVMQ